MLPRSIYGTVVDVSSIKQELFRCHSKVAYGGNFNHKYVNKCEIQIYK